MDVKEVKVSQRPVVGSASTSTRVLPLSTSVRSIPSQLQKPGTNKPLGKESPNSIN